MQMELLRRQMHSATSTTIHRTAVIATSLHCIENRCFAEMERRPETRFGQRSAGRLFFVVDDDAFFLE